MSQLLPRILIHLKSEQIIKLKEELAAPLRSMQEIAKRIAKVSKESKIEIDETEYRQRLEVLRADGRGTGKSP